jgi:uncharacterized protein (TIRG00374 family)
MRLNRQWLSQASLAALGVVVGVSLGLLAVRGTDWRVVGETLKDIPFWVFVPAVGLVIASSYLRALRWSMMWLDRRVSAVRLMMVENAAIGLNNLAPIRIFDEGVILGILTLRDKLPAGQVVATGIMARIQDLAFTLLFVSLAVIFLPALWIYAPVVFGAILFFAGWLLLLLFFNKIAERFPVVRRIPGVSSFQEGIRELWRRKRLLVTTYIITAAYWLLLAPVGLLLARAVGIDLPFHLIMVTVLGTTFFSTAVPGLPGALGTFQFATVQLLSLWDVPQDQALSFAILLHAVLFLPITAYTVFVLPREGIGSVRALREMLRTRRSNGQVNSTASEGPARG